MTTPLEVNNISARTQYRPEIDGLRAFAVVTVIVNHFNKGILPGGYLGVDIFFLISGYVITSSLLRRKSKDFKDFISGFYERRVKRLIPALSIFVLITSIAICFFNPNPGFYIKTGLSSLFGLSNLVLYNNSTQYFSESTALNVFTHTWSLGVEEQFYLIFPFLIWFSGFGRQTKNGARNLFLIVGALTTISLISFLYLYPTNQPAAYFLMPARFWEMAAGCLIFIVFQKRASIKKLLERVPPLIVITLILVVMYLPMSMAQASTITVVVLSSVLIACLRKETLAFKFFTNKIVVYIGLISYSLYLWHWGVLSISRWTIGIHWWTIPFQVALIMGLAILSYEWIETPLRKGNWLGKRWKTLTVGGGIIMTLSTLLITIVKSNGILYAGIDTEESLRNVVAKNIRNNHCDFRLSKVSSFKRNDIERCNFGLKNKNIKGKYQSFYFVGSSHAGTLSGMIGNLNIKESSRLYSLYVGSTFFPTIQSDLFPKDYKKILKKFNQKQNFIRNKIKKSVFSNDVVVIANHIELFGTSISPVSANHKAIVQQYFANLEKFTLEMQSLGVNVVLLGPMPYFTNLKKYMNNTLNCRMEWFRKRINKNCLQSLQRIKFVDSNSIINDFSRNWQNSYENAYFFPVIDYFCPPNLTYCTNQVNKKFYMYDQDHLNYYGGKLLSTHFIEFLKTNGLLK